MIRRPPRSTLDRSSAASDVYKRQVVHHGGNDRSRRGSRGAGDRHRVTRQRGSRGHGAVSYTHLRAHETVLDLVCRLLHEKPHDYLAGAAAYKLSDDVQADQSNYA